MTAREQKNTVQQKMFAWCKGNKKKERALNYFHEFLLYFDFEKKKADEASKKPYLFLMPEDLALHYGRHVREGREAIMKRMISHC